MLKRTCEHGLMTANIHSVTSPTHPFSMVHVVLFSSLITVYTAMLVDQYRCTIIIIIIVACNRGEFRE